MKLEDAIKGIMKYREAIHSQHMWSDPVRLSEVLVKLSVCNSYLADNIAPLHKHATDTAYSIYTEAKASGEAIKTAEMMSRGESTEERKEYENVSNIYRSTNSLITVIQSRIKVLENQLKNEGQIN